MARAGALPQVNYGIKGNQLKFDTVGWATLAVFDLMNLEEWGDVLWSVGDGAGTHTRGAARHGLFGARDTSARVERGDVERRDVERRDVERRDVEGRDVDEASSRSRATNPGGPTSTL